jgi:hypothetical protein
MNAQNHYEDGIGAEGWPADNRPIFIESGFGHVQPSHPAVDGMGERRHLTRGAMVPSNAGEEEFARAWAEILADEPSPAELWEYSVEMPEPGRDPRTTDALPLDIALDRVRTTPGARLRRRSICRWQIVKTPFPSFEKTGWADLEPEKQAWHAAMCEFPPSYRGSISRMGSVDSSPSEWIEFARRAAAAEYSPSDYRMLGTAHLAWTARQAASPSTLRSGREIPPLASIELWARFPRLIAAGRSPLEAISQIIARQ